MSDRSLPPATAKGRQDIGLRSCWGEARFFTPSETAPDNQEKSKGGVDGK